MDQTLLTYVFIILLYIFSGNIPNGDVVQGEVISPYLPPCPIKGTGYHRFAFCLLNQTCRCDFEEMHKTYSARCLTSRSFKTVTFLDNFQLDPVGLSFFQADWDRTVSDTFTEILGNFLPYYTALSCTTVPHMRRAFGFTLLKECTLCHHYPPLLTCLYIFYFVAGIKEPVYDLEPFLTPNQKKRLQVKEIFEKKYTNM
jgi:hypothetical protein